MLRDDRSAPLDLSSNLANHACVLEAQEEYDEALEAIVEALEIREALVEPTHYRLGWDYKRKGSILKRMGLAEESAAAYAKARQIEAANKN